MAIDLTTRLDDETKKAQAFQANQNPIQTAFSPAVPTLGSGLQGMSRVISDIGVSAPQTQATTQQPSGLITSDLQSPGTMVDMAADNKAMAAANAIRKQMVDAQPKGGAATLRDTAADAWNARMENEGKVQKITDLMARNPNMAGALSGALSQTVAGQAQQDVEQIRQRNNAGIEMAKLGLTARGQDINAMSEANRNAVVTRGQDISANTDAVRLGLDKQRLGFQQQDVNRAGEKWAIEKGVVQGQAQDAQAIRDARAELTAAINSGDQAKVEAAKAKAIAVGVKFDKPTNEFTSVTDSMGLNITRTNKDTGAIDIIDPKTGKVQSIPAPGSKPVAASQAPVPQGYTIVGTSGGKRVLQDAKGNRFVEGN